MSKRIIEVGTRQSRQTTARQWEPAPPRDIVQGNLIAEWKECWAAVDAFNTLAAEPVPTNLLKKCKYNENYARNVQVQSLITIMAGIMHRIWAKLGGVNPATLTPGHRKARAIAQQWSEMPEMPKTYSEKFQPVALVWLGRSLEDSKRLHAALTEATQTGKKVVATRWFVPDPVKDEESEQSTVDESAEQSQS